MKAVAILGALGFLVLIGALFGAGIALTALLVGGIVYGIVRSGRSNHQRSTAVSPQAVAPQIASPAPSSHAEPPLPTFDSSTPQFDPRGLPLLPPGELVYCFDDGRVCWRATSVPEAKQILASLKLRKKEFALAKRALKLQTQQIRASYTEYTRTRAPMLRGGRGLGRLVRGVQSIERASRRANLAGDLAPVEAQIARLDAWLLNIDSVSLQVQTYVHQQTVQS